MNQIDLDEFRAQLPRGAVLFNSAIDRKRLERARRAQGIAVLSIEVSFFDVSEALVEAGVLAADLCENREAVARAIEQLLQELSERHA